MDYGNWRETLKVTIGASKYKRSMTIFTKHLKKSFPIEQLLQTIHTCFAVFDKAMAN
jgi:hypothetical protein